MGCACGKAEEREFERQRSLSKQPSQRCGDSRLYGSVRVARYDLDHAVPLRERPADHHVKRRRVQSVMPRKEEWMARRSVKAQGGRESIRMASAGKEGLK
jgi:hypothetical protein